MKKAEIITAINASDELSSKFAVELDIDMNVPENAATFDKKLSNMSAAELLAKYEEFIKEPVETNNISTKPVIKYNPMGMAISLYSEPYIFEDSVDTSGNYKHSVATLSFAKPIRVIIKDKETDTNEVAMRDFIYLSSGELRNLARDMGLPVSKVEDYENDEGVWQGVKFDYELGQKVQMMLAVNDTVNIVSTYHGIGDTYTIRGAEHEYERISVYNKCTPKVNYMLWKEGRSIDSQAYATAKIDAEAKSVF